MKPLAVSVEEAGKLLGISKWLAYKLVKEGKLPSKMLGEKRLVVPYTALEQMLAD